MVKFASPPVINAVSISLAVHCHTEWWGVVSLGMMTVKINYRRTYIIFKDFQFSTNPEEYMYRRIPLIRSKN